LNLRPAIDQDWGDRTADRILSKVIPDRATGCLSWTAAKDSDGYAILQVSGIAARAHRVAYELVIGGLVSGLSLDHVCRNRGCINPFHLEQVTNKENILRGNGLAARNARKTHCKNGHALSGDNMRYNRAGSRICRTCAREYQREYKRGT